MPGIQTKLQRWYWEHGIGNESRQKSDPKIEEEFSRTKKCFFCGEQNPKFLEEHHLIPKRLHDLLPAEFHIIFDFERTVTLCRNCHRRFHVLIKELVTVLEKVLNLDKDNGLYVYDRIMLFLLLNLNGWYLKEVYAEYENFCRRLGATPSFDEIYRLFEYYQRKGLLRMVKAHKIKDCRIIIDRDPNKLSKLNRTSIY